MAARAPTLTQCLLAVSLLSLGAHAQLSTTFYASSCPNLQSIVRAAMTQAVSNERRIGASLLRLFFHDCFVQGCDGSILLDAGGEKTAGPNANSVRGFEVIDSIKRNVEAACPGVVSCADILALAARDGTNLLGGPSWNVPLGRRDSTTASASLANQNLPPSTASLGTLVSLFGRQGLSARDMTALSGAHTIGQARCTTFRARIYGGDADIDASFAALRQQTCPRSGGDGSLAPIDVQTPAAFDTAYFTNLLSRRGLFHSDQELFNGGSQDALVRQYSANPSLFNSDFVAAMIKMGNIGAGNAGQIRRNCRVVNS
ncbi:peroxidase P7-like [Panicum miliaceum]|uniref:Peroxidase n=1 Tax=Panicum miliaceum TaxID=4540 RepID=A0A3L6S3L9_PANMI|nr:peroxidase P7-like [Panicum miliaceum]